MRSGSPNQALAKPREVCSARGSGVEAAVGGEKLEHVVVRQCVAYPAFATHDLGCRPEGVEHRLLGGVDHGFEHVVEVAVGHVRGRRLPARPPPWRSESDERAQSTRAWASAVCTAALTSPGVERTPLRRADLLDDVVEPLELSLDRPHSPFQGDTEGSRLTVRARRLVANPPELLEHA